jgi:hypothetical protein
MNKEKIVQTFSRKADRIAVHDCDVRECETPCSEFVKYIKRVHLQTSRTAFRSLQPEGESSGSCVSVTVMH